MKARIFFQKESGSGINLSGIEKGPRRWLKELVREVLPGLGSAEVDGCAVLGGTNCHPMGNKDCFELYMQAERRRESGNRDETNESDLFRAAFWIFTGADRVKQKIDAAHAFIVDTGIVGKLHIDEIVKDLGGTPDPDGDLGKWLSLSLSAVSSVS
jgi:hypothetical protein